MISLHTVFFSIVLAYFRILVCPEKYMYIVFVVIPFFKSDICSNSSPTLEVGVFLLEEDKRDSILMF